MDLTSLKKYNDNYKYIPQVIGVFSKYLHSVPLRSKTGAAVASAFKAILLDPRYSKPMRMRPVWVRTDKGKEFLNAEFQVLIKRAGIQFQICKNPTLIVLLLKELIERYSINCSGTLPTNIPTGISMSCQNSCRVTMPQFTLQRGWHPKNWAIKTSHQSGIG
jgi:hypothetical protein